MNETKEYFVQIKDSEEETYSFKAKPKTILNHIDMSDVTGEEIRVYDISTFGMVKPLIVNGCWHNPQKPLYISVTDDTGNIIFDGFGTDH